MFPFPLLPILVLPLYPDQEECKQGKTDEQTRGTEPPDKRITQKIILDLVVSPATHSQTEFQHRPIRRLGSKDVVLVRVRHERVVRGHHCNV